MTDAHERLGSEFDRAKILERLSAPEAKPNCGTCRFYAERMCKRHAPVFIRRPVGFDDTAVWPGVSPFFDWCGDHDPIASEE